MTNKYLHLMEELEKTGTGKMTCFGSSMQPILSSGATCTFKREDEYAVGDIVFCKVKGRFIDAHKITKIREQGGTRHYLIANNKGWENGWTKTVYGRVVKASGPGSRAEVSFDRR
jgi:hypothetical protein